MRFGIKLSFADFCEQSMGKTMFGEQFGEMNNFLDCLSNEFDVVELSAIYKDTNPETLKTAAAMCHKHGLSVTIHGAIDGISGGEEFFAPYLLLFETGIQPVYNITVHPLKNPEETERILRSVCEHIDKNNYPVRITLENQRYADESFKNTLCKDVAGVVKNINHKSLYTCFDFGHKHSNILKYGETFDVVEDDFLVLVRHTHIHSVYEGGTHFPLTCGEAALEGNIVGLLKYGYDEVLLLELLPGRYSDKFDIKESVFDSVSVLKTALAQVERKLEACAKYESGYADSVASVRNCLKDGNGLGVLGPSSYIIKLGNTKIAVDISLWNLPVDNEGRKALLELLSECDALIITHKHADHFDREIINNIPTEIPCFIPDFIDCDRENVIKTRDGYEAVLKDINLTFFESAHGADGNIVPEYGFCIGFEGKNYLFPTDVRDYKEEHRVFENTEVLIAHLWLGRANALNIHNNSYVNDFSAFARSFGAKRVYLSHMFDVRREIEDMWTDIHSDLVKEIIDNVNVIKTGDWIKL